MPNTAFALIIAGVLLTYGEFIWVGKVVFGVAGASLALAGIALLTRMPHTNLGVGLMATAIGCFGIDSAVKTYWIAGAVGTVLLACGFWQICSEPPGIMPQLAFPVCAVFGAITTRLLSIARQGRQNKKHC